MAVSLLVMVSSCLSATPWAGDFAVQPPGNRPALDVRYTDASRTAFEIVADRYGLIGELRKPHRLVDGETGDLWLTLGVETDDGTYSTSFADPQWTSCPPGRRVHIRGKVYLFEGTLEDLLRRVRREIPPLSAGSPL